MENHIDTAGLLELIAQQNIVIYGAGHIAGKFLKALRMHHCEKNISCFVVSSPDQSGGLMEGIPVRTAEWLKEHRDLLVCIAVHESLRQDITSSLRAAGIFRYIWIYPWLYELLLGVPVKTKVKVDVEEILRTCTDDYRMAVRYAAIEQYCGKNEIGFDLYRRAQTLHSSPDTAAERLASFCRLMEAWDKNGYDEGSRIAISTDYEIIDGNHRAALARYYKQKQVVCDIYENCIDVTSLHGENAMLTERVLRREGFDNAEIAYLDEINRAIEDGK